MTNTGKWALVLAAAVIGNGLIQSANPPRSDDLTFLKWAAERAWDPWTPMFRSPPFPGWRPLNAFAWWASVSVDGVRALLPQVCETGLWFLSVLGVAGWVRARWGSREALVAIALLLATDRFRDLVCWRSWITSTGEIAFVALALWALERKRTVAAVLAGVAAAWFKEPGGVIVATAALVVYRRPGVAVGVMLGAAPGLAKAVHDVGASGSIPANFLAYSRFLLTTGWPAVAVWVCRRHHTPDLLRWLVVAAVAALPPMAYHTNNPTYLVEAMVIGAAAVSSAFVREPRWLVLALALSAWTVVPSASNARWQAFQLRAQLRTWTEVLALNPTGWSLDPDASDAARWAALRLAFDRGIPESPGGVPFADGLRIDAPLPAP